MNNKLVLVISLIIIIIVIIALAFLPPDLSPKELAKYMMTVKKEDSFFVYEMIRYPAYGEIIKTEIINETIKIGIATDITELNFGQVPEKGSFGKRYVNVNNTDEGDVKVSLRAYGNITPWIDFGKNDFILHKNKSEEVPVYFKTKIDNRTANLGIYEGEIDIIIKRPKSEFSNWLMGFA